MYGYIVERDFCDYATNDYPLLFKVFMKRKDAFCWAQKLNSRYYEKYFKGKKIAAREKDSRGWLYRRYYEAEDYTLRITVSKIEVIL